MYTLHIGNTNYSSWSLRPWVLLHMLKIPFVEAVHDFQPQSNWVAFRQFSPTGTVPCLVDGELAIGDSLAMTEYLAEMHRGVWPESPQARAWARSVAAEIHAGFFGLRQECPMSVGVRIRQHETSERLAHEIRRVREIVESGLSRFGGPFLIGDAFTASDAFLAPFAFRAQTYQRSFGHTTDLYFQRLLSLEPMQAWEDRALFDPWREPGHEAEVDGAGVLERDLRANSAANSGCSAQRHDADWQEERGEGPNVQTGAQ